MKISLTSNWKKELEQAGITYLPDSAFPWNLLEGKTFLPVTSCSRTKGGIDSGVPKEFYISKRNLAFYSWCEYHHLPYGILSDKYGLHYYTEKRDWYDIHPSELGDNEFRVLGEKVKQSMKKYKLKGLVFCNSSPYMSIPYFKIMKFSGAETIFVTKLVYKSSKKGFF